MPKVALEPGCVNQDRLGVAALTNPSSSIQQSFSSCTCYISIRCGLGALFLITVALGPRLSKQPASDALLVPLQKGRETFGGSHITGQVLGLEVAHLPSAHNSLATTSHMTSSKQKAMTDNLSICPEGAELEIFHEQHYELLRELWLISGPGNSRSRALPAAPRVACLSRGWRSIMAEGRRGMAQQLSSTP